MENKKSFFNRLFKKSDSLKKESVKMEDVYSPITDDLYEEEENPPFAKIKEKKIAEAKAANNRIEYGNEHFLILQTKQSFYGNKGHESVNRVSLVFDLHGKDCVDLCLNFYLPLYQKRLDNGCYFYSSSIQSGKMNGEFDFYYDVNNDFENEKVKITGGSVEFRGYGESYEITGKLTCENGKEVQISYKGTLNFYNFAPEANGTGEILYDCKKYPVQIAFERYQGMKSDLNTKTFKWIHKFEIYLDLTDEVNNCIFLTLRIAQNIGETLQAGEYSFSEDEYETPSGTFRGWITLSSKDEEKEKRTLSIESGTIKVTHTDLLKIEGECRLENRELLFIKYTGNPEWMNES